MMGTFERPYSAIINGAITKMVSKKEADARIAKLERQLETYRNCSNYWWVAYKRDCEGFVPTPTSSDSDEDEAIRQMDRQREEMQRKAAALDWLEVNGRSLSFYVRSQDWHCTSLISDFAGTGRTPTEAIENLKQQVEGE